MRIFDNGEEIHYCSICKVPLYPNESCYYGTKTGRFFFCVKHYKDFIGRLDLSRNTTKKMQSKTMKLDADNLRLINIIITKLIALKKGKTLQRYDSNRVVMDIGIATLSELTLRELCEESTVWVKPDEPKKVLVKKPLPNYAYHASMQVRHVSEPNKIYSLFYVDKDCIKFHDRVGMVNAYEVSDLHLTGLEFYDEINRQWFKPYNEVWETPATT